MKMESYLRRANQPLQQIAKTVLLGANEVKRMKTEISSLKAIIKKQEKKYSKLYKTYARWHQSNIAKQQTITNSEMPS